MEMEVQNKKFSLKKIFKIQWLITTILAIIGVWVLIRLGFWQLDRLDQRRSFNARVLSQINRAELDLNQGIPLDVASMEFRSATVKGTYDFEHQVALRNQVYQNQSGIRILTPLKIDGTSDYVLIDRGWIPFEDMDPANWSKYDESPQVEVQGMIRASQNSPDFGNRADPTPGPGESMELWHFANIEEMEKQMPYDLIGVFIQQAPADHLSEMPARSLPDIEITEGPHLGYALQWFTFAAILGVGYPYFIYREASSPGDKGKDDEE